MRSPVDDVDALRTAATPPIPASPGPSPALFAPAAAVVRGGGGGNREAREKQIEGTVKQAVREQLLHAKRTVTSRDVGVQHSQLAVASRVLATFCTLALATDAVDIEHSDGFNQWADAASRMMTAAAGGGAAEDETQRRSTQMLAQFCVTLKAYLQRRGCDVDGSDVWLSSRERLSEQAGRIDELEDEIMKLRRRHDVEKAELEAQHRESTRFQIAQALEQAQRASAVRDASDRTTLEFSIATLTNQLSLMHARFDQATAQKETLALRLGERDEEVANLETALMALQHRQHVVQENAMTQLVAETIKVGDHVTDTTRRVAELSAKVTGYADTVKHMELEHQLSLQGHGKTAAATRDFFQDEVCRRDRTIAALHESYMGLLKEHVTLSQKAALKLTTAARAHLQRVGIDEHLVAGTTAAASAMSQGGRGNTNKGDAGGTPSPLLSSSPSPVVPPARLPAASSSIIRGPARPPTVPPASPAAHRQSFRGRKQV